VMSSPANGCWMERAAEITAGLEALLTEPEKIEESREDMSEPINALLERTEALIAEIEAAHPADLDEATRGALEALVHASRTLRGRCSQGMDQLAGQRAALRQGDRALQGYAATSGARDGRYLSDRG